MKNGLWIFLMIFLLATSCFAAIASPGTGNPADMGGQYGGNQQQYGQPEQYGARRNNMDMRSIYNYLAPYGRWIYLRPYGYVWTPRHMGNKWRPYRNGRWVMTEWGWTWIARERWGSIPFHYGRWGYNRYFGWFWVPGRTWGPAWVSWRWSDRYAGWAPLQPGIELRADMDFASLSINIPDRFWIFLQAAHFLAPDIINYALPYERNAAILNSTSQHSNNYFRDNNFYNEGIPVDVVRRVTRRNVQQYSIQDAQQPGLAQISGKKLQIYRPSIQADDSAKPKEFLTEDRAQRELAQDTQAASQAARKDKQAEQAQHNRQAQQDQQDNLVQQELLNKQVRQDQQEKKDKQAEQNKQARQEQQDKQAKQAEQNKQAQQEKQDQQAEQNKKAEEIQKDKENQQAEQNKKAEEIQKDKEDQQAEQNEQVEEVQKDKQDQQDKQDKKDESKKKKKEGNS